MPSVSNISPCQLILYACPTGLLASQIEDYLQESRNQWGENKAHQYMPHCTLTGFFHDQRDAIALYLKTLDKAMAAIAQPPSPIQVTDLMFKEDWHGLTLESPWLQTLARTFAQNAHSPTRTENLRLKTWLHVSLAYGFDPAHGEGLKQLAQERVDPMAAVGWEIRFYERSPQDNQGQMPSNPWTCHGRWRVY